MLPSSDRGTRAQPHRFVPPGAAARVATAFPFAVLLLAGARMILGDGRAIEAGALLVEGGRIAEVGYAGAIPLPRGGVRIDATGTTIIPALIDAHAHLGYEGCTSLGADQYSRRNLVDDLQRYAYYAFGAVGGPRGEDLGGRPGWLPGQDAAGGVPGHRGRGPEEGKSADLVVLDANPLDDIRNTRRIRDVYLRGRRVDRHALREEWRTSKP